MSNLTHERLANPSIEFLETKRNWALANWKEHYKPENPGKFSEVHEIFQTASLATERIFKELGFWAPIEKIVEKHRLDSLTTEDVHSIFVTSRLSPIEEIKEKNFDDFRQLLAYSAVYQELSLLILKQWCTDGTITEESLSAADITGSELKFIIDLSLKIAPAGAKIYLGQHNITEDKRGAIPDHFKEYAFGAQSLYHQNGQYKTLAHLFSKETAEISDALTEASEKVGGTRFEEMQNYLKMLAELVSSHIIDPETIEEDTEKVHKEALRLYGVSPLSVLMHTSWQGVDGNNHIDHAISINWQSERSKKVSADFNQSRNDSRQIAENLGYPSEPPVLFATEKLVQTGQGVASYTQGDPDGEFIYFSCTTVDLTSQLRINLLRTLCPGLTLNDAEIMTGVFRQIESHELAHQTPLVDKRHSIIKEFLGLDMEGNGASDGGGLTDKIDEIRAEFYSYIFENLESSSPTTPMISLAGRLSEYLFCAVTEKGDPDYFFPAQACLYFLSEFGTIRFEDGKILSDGKPEEGLLAMSLIGAVMTDTHYIPETNLVSEKMQQWNRQLMETEVDELTTLINKTNNPSFKSLMSHLGGMSPRIPRYKKI